MMYEEENKFHSEVLMWHFLREHVNDPPLYSLLSPCTDFLYVLVDFLPS
jgi:hypothetical protein